MKNNNTKLSLYRIKNLILQYIFNKKLNIKNNEIDIIFLMNKYANNLKETNLIYTVSDIESIKYGNTSYPDILFNHEVINSLCFYTLILGFLDANIDYIKGKNIKNIREFNNNRILLDNIIEIRNNIYSDYDKYNSYKLINIKEFDYNNFNKLFNINNIDVLECLIAYIIGYMNYNKYNFYTVYNEYIKLTDDLNIYKEKNKDKFEKTKIKKKIL